MGVGVAAAVVGDGAIVGAIVGAGAVVGGGLVGVGVADPPHA